MRLFYGSLLAMLLYFSNALALTDIDDTLTPKQKRAEELKALKNSDMVVYGPKDPKGVVTVFTDFDCGYCRKLHHQIEALTNLGIQLRYLAYPRQGLGSGSYNKMVSIWCSANRQDAMTKAMKGEPLEIKHCQNPVDDQLSLGQRLGIRGTPTMIFADGTVWPGFLTADKIAKEALKHSDKGASE